MPSLQQILKKTKEILSKLDNERLAIAAVTMIGLSLLLFLIIVAPELLEADWFLNILTVLAEYGSFIAGGAYIGRLFNLFTARLFIENEREKTKVATLLNNEVVMGRLIKTHEKELTPIGMLLGMALAIVCIVMHATVPFLSVFSYFAYILFILGYACALGGLFNRLGSSLDGSRLPQEKKAILFATILGLFFALSLLAILAATGTLPLVAVAGISKVFFALFLLHKTLFTITFILSLTSLSASFADYFAKANCFLKYRYHLGKENQQLNACVESRFHEYRGAFLGLVAGSLLAIAIITGLVLTGGLIATPVAVATTLFLTTATCGSVSAALFSRIGRVMDGVNRALVPTVLLKDNTVIAEKDNNEDLIVLPSNGDLGAANEHKMQIHSSKNSLVDSACDQVSQASEQSPQKQADSHDVMEVHLRKRPTKMLEKSSTFFYLPAQKEAQEEVCSSQVDKLVSYSC